MVLSSANILISLLSLVTAFIIGSYLKVDKKVNKLIGVENIFEIEFSKKHTFSTGLLISTMISLIGPLAIIGSIQSGIDGDITLLILKSGFDFVATFILATSLGKGVIYSVFPIIFVEFVFALAGKCLGDIIPEVILTEVLATGGIVLIAMGLTVMKIKRFKIISLLLGIILVPGFYIVFASLGLI